MMEKIISEQFPLTPAIRAHVELAIRQLKLLLPEGADLYVTLDFQSHRDFSVAFRTRALRRDLIVKAVHRDLFTAIQWSANELKRRIRSRKQTLVDRRRRAAPLARVGG